MQGDAIGPDSDDESRLPAAAVPGIGLAGVPVREGVDRLLAAFAGHADYSATHPWVNAAGFFGSEIATAARESLEVSGLLHAVDDVDDDVFAVGGDPGLRQLRRAGRAPKLPRAVLVRC